MPQRSRWGRIHPLALTVAVLLGSACGPPSPNESESEQISGRVEEENPPEGRLRVGVFNIWELSEEKIDRVVEQDPQLRAAAEVIQRLRPDVLLLNEIDVVEGRNLAKEFAQSYLAAAQHVDVQPIAYEHVVYETVNTGIPSGFDLNRDGNATGPEDAWGFGRYPGQYGMAVLSRYPVDRNDVRSWRLLPWRSLPGHLMPDGRDGRPAWYSADQARALRLSSKSHLDVPVLLPNGRVLHLLASHPTPPVFDGDEDRNGRRNYDEIRLWTEILAPNDDRAAGSTWLVDDQGRPGGLASDASFVIAGDLNADPYADTPYGGPAIAQLLNHPRIRDPRPTGDAEPPGARLSGGEYPGPPHSRTSAWGRLDYVLPSADLDVLASGVFLPAEGNPLRRLVEGEERASDHFAVWVDLVMPSN
ncbi:MAG: endonuclease/exonuclease/phosphatase family protein [Thermoanaerobaculia bacterium]|nr:endonuclease/exonuclease/phosphatase family protein [Thermoanaerobaculia bacterium]